MTYTADSNRYNHMAFSACGKSGLKLPKLAVGLWQNFGSEDDFNENTKILCHAFDNGITHFDLANNYGYPAGEAEKTLGKILKNSLLPYRDELIISTKAGFRMWDGPYGDGSSRKYLISSLDSSLKRMGLDYVDIFYSHRYDPTTPIEETVEALTSIVRQGKALYVGLSNYPVEEARKAIWLLGENKTPCLIYQGRYNMLFREEERLFSTLEESRIGFIVYSAMAQGILSNKYLNGIPKGSRAANIHSELHAKDISQELIEKVAKLNDIALQRGQSLAQMAIAWILQHPVVTTCLVGVSSCEQLKDNLKAVENTAFSTEELNAINSIIFN